MAMKKTLFSSDNDEVYYDTPQYLDVKEVYDKAWVVCDHCQITDNATKFTKCKKCGAHVCERCFSTSGASCIRCHSSERERVMRWAVGDEWETIRPIDAIPLIKEHTGVHIDLAMDKNPASIYRRVKDAYYEKQQHKLT